MDPNQITKDIQTIFKAFIMKKSDLFLQITFNYERGLFSNSINKEKCTPLYIQNGFAIVCSRLSIIPRHIVHVYKVWTLYLAE